MPRNNPYLLNLHRYLVSPGITGEVNLYGEHVTHGYWNFDEPTAAASLPNLFAPRTVMYKSSDLGCWKEFS